MLPTPTAFTHEYQMLALIADFLPAFLEPKYSQYFAVPEMSIQGTIPDLLLFSFDEPSIMPARRRLTSTEAHVLQAIRRLGSAAVDDVSGQLILSRTRLLKCVDALRKGGFIEQDRDTYTVSGGVKEHRIEIIAIEMKLKNWRAAREQARLYQEYADRTYVILDGLQVEPTSQMISAYADAGIGLLLQHGWQLDPIIDAREQNSGSADRFIAIQKLIMNYLPSLNASDCATL